MTYCRYDTNSRCCSRDGGGTECAQFPGRIFCHREAARLPGQLLPRADLRLRAADAPRLIASQDLARTSCLDLVTTVRTATGPAVRPVHDQPADAYSVSLEELRCDLTTFAGLRLEGNPGGVVPHGGWCSTRSVRPGCSGSRHGRRVRNYDGLGGQLLFSYLHSTIAAHGPKTAGPSTPGGR